MIAISNYFKDRAVQYPGRIKLTVPGEEDGTTYDLEREEGTVTTEGTPFSAVAFNRIADEMLDAGQENADLVADMLENTLSANSTYFSGGVIKYGQIGSLVVVYVNGTTSSTLIANVSRQIATGMPAAVRPQEIIEGSIRTTSDGILRVTTAGAIQITTGATAIPSGTEIAGEVCYYL